MPLMESLCPGIIPKQCYLLSALRAAFLTIATNLPSIALQPRRGATSGLALTQQENALTLSDLIRRHAAHQNVIG